MNSEAREKRNAYMRAYRAANKERLQQQAKERREADPERFKKYQADYWKRKADFAEGKEEAE